MSVETIVSLLDKLEQLHKSLLTLAYEKTALIKTGDIHRVDQLLKDEQAHVAAIIQMDNERQAVVANYLTEQGSSVPTNPTVAHILQITPEPDKQRLEEARDRLLHAIHELKIQNDLNQKLTYQSLQFVNLSLDMVRPRPESVNYSKTEVQGEQKSSNQASFDSQA